MRKPDILKSTALLAGLLALAVLPALAQQKASSAKTAAEFGSVSGSADRVRYELTAGRITYTGNVEIETDAGDRLTAGRVVLTLNKARTDVETAAATGGVKAKVSQPVKASGNRPAFTRLINASANTADLNVVTRRLVLTGNVAGTSEEPEFIASFRGASVDINLASGIIDAEGSGANRAQVKYVRKKPAGNG